MSERLKKYFTDEELQFIQNMAKQKGMKETDIVYMLAREMIQTYQLRFVSGQQVLAMLDLLAMKLPQWFALQLNLIGQSSLQVTSLSKQLASLAEPSTLDKLIQLIKSPEIVNLINQLIPLIGMFGKNLMGGNSGNSGQNKYEDNNEGEFL